MRILALMALLAPMPAQAIELWCMPSTLCRADGSCSPTTDEESSIRLHDMDSAAPNLRSNAQDVPMTRTHDADVVQWQGTNADGDTEVLALRKSDMTYVYLNRNADREWQATGRCEVQ